jgi:uncharacterized DUF497 family protein
MKNAKQLRNGSLYYNEESKKVERVLGKVNSQRVWTAAHEKGATDVRVKSLRMANSAEVDSYLEESTPEL